MLRLAQSNKRLGKAGRCAGEFLRSSGGWQQCRRARGIGGHRRGGFTLLELLLAVVLVVAVTGAMVFNFTTLTRGSPLVEGTTQLETLMRFARAHAANSGRRVQLVFNGEPTNILAASTGEVRATWEPDPLGQPGSFMELAETQWHVQQINDRVQVESVKLLDSNSACPPAATHSESESEGEEEVDVSDLAPARNFAPITFYPDGSSDSAEIIVAARSFEEDTRMAVRLVGITGTISRHLLSADSIEVMGESGFAERYGPSRRDGGLRPVGAEPEAVSPVLNPTRSSASAPRPVSAAPRTTVGETNSVDYID